jgi:hypothetical protein
MSPTHHDRRPMLPALTLQIPILSDGAHSSDATFRRGLYASRAFDIWLGLAVVKYDALSCCNVGRPRQCY